MSSRSQLLTVRLWKEDLGDGQSEWRGKVQHVSSGEAVYFREWEELVETIQTLILGHESEHK